ncbi:MAG TPA: peptide ABC transporter substrate-binding protein [Actinomycetota bacterium]|nr:peptide ABC transporter substrate-binding protein [Actinomycetota bacterium]
MPSSRRPPANAGSRRARTLKGLCVLLLVVLLGTACGNDDGGDGTGATGEGRPTRGGLIRVESQEPGSLDPPLGAGSEDARIIRLLFDGLVRYDDETAAVEPGVAERWESNDEATEWTFHLREGTRFSNGEEVTAESFVRGVTRAASPEFYNNPDGLGYHLDGIQGVAERAAGEAPDVPGVEAVDDRTLRFRLTDPDAEFPVRAGHLPFFPIPSDEAIANQRPSWAENPIGNGPFKMKAPWQHNQMIELVRNDEYYGQEPYLDEVRFVITADQDTSYVNWQAGNLDWTRIPPPKTQEARQQNRGNFLIRNMAGIDYLVFTLNHPPMNNKLFRQAVSMSIDRQAITDAVFFGLRTPAAGVVPELIPGSRAEDDDGPCEYCRHDPDRAKELFEQSGVQIDKLTMHFNAGAGHDEWMQAAAQQIANTLGIQTEAIAATTQFTGSGGYTAWLKEGAPASLNRLAWGMDYPSAANFLRPLLYSNSNDNKSNYNNQQYDRLIDQARGETDEDERERLYREAEDIALEDMPIVPMWWRTQFRLVKLDRFGGLEIDPFEDPTLRTAYVKGDAEGAEEGGDDASPGGGPAESPGGGAASPGGGAASPGAAAGGATGAATPAQSPPAAAGVSPPAPTTKSVAIP